VSVSEGGKDDAVFIPLVRNKSPIIHTTSLELQDGKNAPLATFHSERGHHVSVNYREDRLMCRARCRGIKIHRGLCLEGNPKIVLQMPLCTRELNEQVYFASSERLNSIIEKSGALK
jgi:hypothetical protein